MRSSSALVKTVWSQAAGRHDRQAHLLRDACRPSILTPTWRQPSMRSTLPLEPASWVAPWERFPSLLFIQKMLQRHHHGYDQWADAHTVV
jgi:hypothetical protein